MPGSKTTTVRFHKSDDAVVALYLTQTFFIDRALYVNKMPEDGSSLPAVVTPISLVAAPGLAIPPLAAVPANLSVYVGNLPPTSSNEELLRLFSPCGPITMARIAGEDPVTKAFVPHISY